MKIALAVVGLCLLLCGAVFVIAEVKIVVVPPMPGYPDGAVLLVRASDAFNIVDSPDAVCERENGDATLICRAAKAAPVVPIVGSVASPIKGMAVLTDAQASDLQKGLWYFNLHTVKYPDGELRGQLITTDKSAATAPAATTKTPAPAAAATPAAPAKVSPPAVKPAAVPATNQFATEVLAKSHCPAATVVWVNIKSQILHFSGYKDYGTTKEGAYMCEVDATTEGARAAKEEKHP